MTNLLKVQTLLTQTQFLEWLQTQPSDAIVGEECKSGSCPIHNYLASHGIEAKIGNWFDMSTIEVEGVSAPLVDWVKDFAHAVDEGECSVPVLIPESEVPADFDGYTDDDGNPIRYCVQAALAIQQIEYMMSP